MYSCWNWRSGIVDNQRTGLDDYREVYLFGIQVDMDIASERFLKKRLVRHDGSAWKNAELFLSGSIIPIILDQVEGRDTL